MCEHQSKGLGLAMAVELASNSR